MTNATIAVKGSASDEFPADYALVFISYEFNAPARSEALERGNAVITQVRDAARGLGKGVREVKIQSLRVFETFNQVGPDHVQEHTGWGARTAGQLQVEPSAVPEAVAVLAKVGVTINQLSWHLDPPSEAEAHRAVRRMAVIDAKDAANDFALALGAKLGDLITLADPGLLGPATFQSGTRRSQYMATATFGVHGASWNERVDVDPDVITVSAHVEASYEVTFD